MDEVKRAMENRLTDYGAKNEDPAAVMAHEGLDVYQLAVEVSLLIEEVVAGCPPQRAYLIDQVRRSSSSIVLNIAEGAGRRSAQDKSRFFIIARGSACETSAALDLFQAARCVSLADFAKGKVLLRRIVGALTKMAGI